MRRPILHTLLNTLLISVAFGELPSQWLNDQSFVQSCLTPLNIESMREYVPVFTESPILNGSCLITDFEDVKFLGTGQFGQARLAKHKPTNTLVVLKNIFQSQHRSKVFQTVRNEECTFHVASRHISTVPLHYCTMVDGVDVVLAMEWVEGRTLASTLRSKKSSSVLTVETFQSILSQLIITVEMLHDLRIMFYDIRTKNLMLRKEDRQIRLIDFGLASFHYPDSPPKEFHTPSPPTFPPAHVPHIDDFAEPDRPILDDWYDVGLLIYATYTSGVNPFSRMISEYKFRLKYETGLQCPHSMDTEACSLFKKLCSPVVESRFGLLPDSKALFRQHPYLISANWTEPTC